MALVAILQSLFRKEIGLQFFWYFMSLFSVIKDITPRHCEIDSDPL